MTIDQLSVFGIQLCAAFKIRCEPICDCNTDYRLVQPPNLGMLQQ